jgi:hypothetical protein
MTGLLFNRDGAAAVEMALVFPLLMILMLGSVELGNYFYNEHKLVKAVRDGARFAARQGMSNYTACSGSPPQAVIDDTKLMVRKGTLDSSAPDLLPSWGSATFTMTISCTATLNTGAGPYAAGGIYANLPGGAPTVVVTASLPYRPILGVPFGFSGLGRSVNATQSAAVAGI